MTRLALPFIIFAILLLAGCQTNDPPPPVEATPRPPAASPTSALLPISPTIVIDNTPEIIEVRIWGPPELSPHADSEVGVLFEAQRRAFEADVENTLLTYEPKAENGDASLLEYLSSASAVAPAVLPDIIIFPTGQLDALEASQLLVPLESLVSRALREDLYLFAQRDTQLNERWVAIPYSLQVEHAVYRNDSSRTPPTELHALTSANAARWLFNGQGYENGEMSNALLVQLTALESRLPDANAPLDPALLEQLAEIFQEASEEGAVPRTVLSLSDESELYRRLQNRQADWIQSNSSAFLHRLNEGEAIAFAPLPTLEGAKVAIVEGYVVAITATDNDRQAAAARWIEWAFTPERLAEWNRLTDGIPATRPALLQTVDDRDYAAFLDETLQNSWIRPGGSAWREYARNIQEQFRALMQEELTPAEFVVAVNGRE